MAALGVAVQDLIKGTKPAEVLADIAKPYKDNRANLD
jgi:hypothetical protein